MSNEDTLRALGKLVPEGMGRDAVHVAVVPMVAGIMLMPGRHVGVAADGRLTVQEPYIGIVDPYLTNPVKADERCWLFLYPGSITSLRHEWTHPALPDESIVIVPTGMSASEKWMRAWAMEHVSENYYADGTFSEEEAYQYAINAGHTHSIGPYESARDYIDSEWWTHWEIITGASGDREAYFSCAC